MLARIRPIIASMAMPRMSETKNNGQSTLARSSGTCRKSTPKVMVITTASEPVQKARHAAPQPVGRDADGGDIHIFEGLVMFAVLDHGPRDAGHHGADIDIEGVPKIDIREDRRVEVAFGDDAVHHDQDAGAGQRLDDRIDREQERDRSSSIRSASRARWPP